MKVLALDVGGRRIGVAISGPSGLLAEPLTTLPRRRDDAAVEGVVRLVHQHAVDEVVVGIPLETSGQEGDQARRVRSFLRKLAHRLPVPIREVDERYSTQEALRLLQERGIPSPRRKEKVDAVAAAVILQTYLDARRREGSPPTTG